jgi:hypothetical protein
MLAASTEMFLAPTPPECQIALSTRQNSSMRVHAITANKIFDKPIDKAVKTLRARRFALKDKVARAKLTRNMKLMTREVFDDPSDTIKDLARPIKEMLLKTVKEFYNNDKGTRCATADVLDRCVDSGVHVSNDDVVTFLYGKKCEKGKLTTEMKLCIEPERNGFRVVDVEFVNTTYEKATKFARASPCVQLNMAAFQAERHAKHVAVNMLNAFFPMMTDSMVLSECVGTADASETF